MKIPITILFLLAAQLVISQHQEEVYKNSTESLAVSYKIDSLKQKKAKALKQELKQSNSNSNNAGNKKLYIGNTSVGRKNSFKLEKRADSINK